MKSRANEILINDYGFLQLNIIFSSFTQFRHRPVVARQLAKTDCKLGRAGGKSEIPGALCVEMGFTWTIPRNQDAKVKLKS